MGGETRGEEKGPLVLFSYFVRIVSLFFFFK